MNILEHLVCFHDSGDSIVVFPWILTFHSNTCSWPSVMASPGQTTCYHNHIRTIATHTVPYNMGRFIGMFVTVQNLTTLPSTVANAHSCYKLHIYNKLAMVPQYSIPPFTTYKIWSLLTSGSPPNKIKLYNFIPFIFYKLCKDVKMCSHLHYSPVRMLFACMQEVMCLLTGLACQQASRHTKSLW